MSTHFHLILVLGMTNQSRQARSSELPGTYLEPVGEILTNFYLLQSPFNRSHTIGQFIRPNSEKNDLSSFLFQNVHLLLMLLIGHFSVMIVSFLIKSSRWQTNVFERLKSTAVRMLFDNPSSPSKVAFKLAALLLCFNWFLFFNLNFISGTIKTVR